MVDTLFGRIGRFDALVALTHWSLSRNLVWWTFSQLGVVDSPNLVWWTPFKRARTAHWSLSRDRRINNYATKTITTEWFSLVFSGSSVFNMSIEQEYAMLDKLHAVCNEA